jgi:hypothetical protein
MRQRLSRSGSDSWRARWPEINSQRARRVSTGDELAAVACVGAAEHVAYVLGHSVAADMQLLGGVSGGVTAGNETQDSGLARC